VNGIHESLTRVVGHFDLDYFYAQVEEVEDPSLRGLPVVVCVYSGRTEDSGVVSTANYKARALGVKSGIPIALAKKRLEGVNARFIPMHREKYEVYSQRIMSMLRDETEVTEQTGIDEAFFDITTKTEGDFELARGIASEIKRQLLLKEKLTCSIGLGPNKVVAKLASDFVKPDGLTAVAPQQVKSFLDPLPIDKLYGIGSKSSALLKEKGVTTIAELSKTDLPLLEELFGRKLAIYIHNAANGVDEEAVRERGEATQVSRIITLKKDSQDLDEILTQLTPTFEDIRNKVVEKNLFFRTVSVIGILTDLSIRTRTKTLDMPTAELSAISENALPLLSSLVKDSGKLRRAGIRVADFAQAKEQSSLAEFLR
jgi:DNA polymerase IV (archaeal DinB-like DNA polymerase)